MRTSNNHSSSRVPEGEKSDLKPPQNVGHRDENRLFEESEESIEDEIECEGNEGGDAQEDIQEVIRQPDNAIRYGNWVVPAPVRRYTGKLSRMEASVGERALTHRWYPAIRNPLPPIWDDIYAMTELIFDAIMQMDEVVDNQTSKGEKGQAIRAIKNGHCPQNLIWQSAHSITLTAELFLELGIQSMSFTSSVFYFKQNR